MEPRVVSFNRMVSQKRVALSVWRAMGAYPRVARAQLVAVGGATTAQQPNSSRQRDSTAAMKRRRRPYPTAGA